MGFLSSLLGQTALQTPFDWWAAWGIFIVVFSVLWLIIIILVAIWVYRDAESRGMGGALWLIIIILLPILGLIIYLIVRSDKPVGGQQPSYGGYQQQPYQQPAHQQYQPPPAQQYAPPTAPTYQQAPTSKTCPKCGAANSGTAGFCQSCGNRL